MPNTDLDRLQGIWHIDSLEMGGSAMPAAAFTNARVVMNGERFESLGMGVVYEGTVVLHPDESPKQFDLRFTAGPEAGNTNLGIYKLEGDTWTLCLGLTGAGRPSEFATRSGSQQALQVLRRAAVERSTKPQAALKGETVPEFDGEWQMTSCVISGQKLPEAFLMGRRVVHGNHLVVTMAGKAILEATYGAEPAASPKTLDYLLRNGSMQYGIWEFEGPILRTCLSPIGQNRPGDFTSTNGDGRILTEWRRI